MRHHQAIDESVLTGGPARSGTEGLQARGAPATHLIQLGRVGHDAAGPVAHLPVGELRRRDAPRAPVQCEPGDPGAGEYRAIGEAVGFALAGLELVGHEQLHRLGVTPREGHHAVQYPRRAVVPDSVAGREQDLRFEPAAGLGNEHRTRRSRGPLGTAGRAATRESRNRKQGCSSTPPDIHPQ